MALATGKLGLSLSDFFELTPMELKQINDMHRESRIEFFHCIQIAGYMGFGQAYSGKRFKSVFESRKRKAVRSLADEEKLEDLLYIQSRLGSVT
jgi:hypothetical protein